MPGYNTSPSGLSAVGSKGDAALSAAKAGSPKGSSGTYSDRPEAPYAGPAGVSGNSINKPAVPKPAGSTSDTGREKP
jgi:hypothetical protein